MSMIFRKWFVDHFVWKPRKLNGIGKCSATNKFILYLIDWQSKLLTLSTKNGNIEREKKVQKHLQSNRWYSAMSKLLMLKNIKKCEKGKRFDFHSVETFKRWRKKINNLLLWVYHHQFSSCSVKLLHCFWRYFKNLTSNEKTIMQIYDCLQVFEWWIR